MPDDVTRALDSELAHQEPASVTPGPVPAAERMRRMRARKKAAVVAAPLLFERADWTLFVRPESLPQKAGCQPRQIGRILVKELTDNALDTGAEVEVVPISGGYRIIDRGPGIDPAEVPRLFAVNRPLLSSKLKRLPLRGMLGNGLRVVMGAVVAYGGTTRGHRLALAVDTVTGLTSITSDTPVPEEPGTAVEITLHQFDGEELELVELSLTVAPRGKQYSGPSRPSWYNVDDLRELLARVTPDTATVDNVLRDVFAVDVDDQRIATKLSPGDVSELYWELRRISTSRRVEVIGYIGNSKDEPYGRVDGIARIGIAEIPYCVESWANCDHAGKSADTSGTVHLLLNRSPTIAPLWFSADSSGLDVEGCGLDLVVRGAKRASYRIVISVITPYVRLMNDGKTPYLGDFHDAVMRVVQKAAGAAYRAMVRPKKKMSIKDAAWAVMAEAYLKASDNGQLPANARQILYAARPLILKLAEIEKFRDGYFTQALLPDYVVTHPDRCADWDVVFDARGHFVEPHTGLSVPLGTLEVRGYLGDRPTLGPAVTLDAGEMYPTRGPDNRYRNVLYVEKEGFDPLLAAARIAERFDLAIMSTKGMSVTAARLLLDRLAPKIDRLFVLHDFDVSGFTLAGTLTADGRRYIYKNAVDMVDLGLRLADVEAMDLQSEPVTVEGGRGARAMTLRKHGALEQEIDFLLGYDGGPPRRVELNAMTSRQFVDFLERKLTEHGVAKVVPEPEIIEQHARRLIEQRLAKEALDKIRDQLAKEAAAHELPSDLGDQVRRLLTEQPQVSWDGALATILRQR
jgi:hypothetical protein